MDTNEVRDQEIVREYVEGATLKQLKHTHRITHERVRQILIGQGISLRKPGPVTSKVSKSFGKLTTRERFLNQIKVIPDAALGDHWIWPHKVPRGRYGKFIIKGHGLCYAHRAAFFLVKGRFPIGRLRKTCSVYNCVHPDHWREKTASVS